MIDQHLEVLCHQIGQNKALGFCQKGVPLPLILPIYQINYFMKKPTVYLLKYVEEQLTVRGIEIGTVIRASPVHH